MGAFLRVAAMRHTRIAREERLEEGDAAQRRDERGDEPRRDEMRRNEMRRDETRDGPNASSKRNERTRRKKGTRVESRSDGEREREKERVRRGNKPGVSS